MLCREPKPKLGISQHPCYHGPMTGKEAEIKLKEMGGGTFYLMRFSVSRGEQMLSVAGKIEDDTIMTEHFPIKTVSKYDQSEYEIKGSEKRFEDISELLHYYERNPINYHFRCIGKPAAKKFPPKTFSPPLRQQHKYGMVNT